MHRLAAAGVVGHRLYRSRAALERLLAAEHIGVDVGPGGGGEVATGNRGIGQDVGGRIGEDLLAGGHFTFEVDGGARGVGVGVVADFHKRQAVAVRAGDSRQSSLDLLQRHRVAGGVGELQRLSGTIGCRQAGRGRGAADADVAVATQDLHFLGVGRRDRRACRGDRAGSAADIGIVVLGAARGRVATVRAVVLPHRCAGAVGAVTIGSDAVAGLDTDLVVVGAAVVVVLVKAGVTGAAAIPVQVRRAAIVGAAANRPGHLGVGQVAAVGNGLRATGEEHIAGVAVGRQRGRPAVGRGVECACRNRAGLGEGDHRVRALHGNRRGTDARAADRANDALEAVGRAVGARGRLEGGMQPGGAAAGQMRPAGRRGGAACAGDRLGGHGDGVGRAGDVGRVGRRGTGAAARIRCVGRPAAGTPVILCVARARARVAAIVVGIQVFGRAGVVRLRSLPAVAVPVAIPARSAATAAVHAIPQVAVVRPVPAIAGVAVAAVAVAALVVAGLDADLIKVGAAVQTILVEALVAGAATIPGQFGGAAVVGGIADRPGDAGVAQVAAGRDGQRRAGQEHAARAAAGGQGGHPAVGRGVIDRGGLVAVPRERHLRVGTAHGDRLGADPAAADGAGNALELVGCAVGAGGRVEAGMQPRRAAGTKVGAGRRVANRTRRSRRAIDLADRLCVLPGLTGIQDAVVVNVADIVVAGHDGRRHHIVRVRGGTDVVADLDVGQPCGAGVDDRERVGHLAALVHDDRARLLQHRYAACLLQPGVDRVVDLTGREGDRRGHAA